jgi:translocation and assembly module TamB
MRRWLKFFFAVTALLGVLLIALPWWLGAVVRPAGRIWGVEIGSYERLGYARLRLNNVRYARPGVQVSAARVETDTPLLWTWRKLTRTGSTTAVDHWAVIVTPQPGKNSGSPFGPLQLHALLNRIAPALQRWLPRATAQNGAVRWPGGSLRLTEAKWEGRTLQLRGLGWQHGSVDGTIAVGADQVIAIEAGQGSDLRTRIRWGGPEASGDFSAWAQTMPVQARFGEQGWLPVEAGAEAVNWTVPSASIGLGAQYGPLHGDGRASWKDGAFQVSLNASAEPLTAGGVPALGLRADAHGDRQAWTITALHLAAPFASAELSDPVVVGFDGRVRSGPARLSFQTDLALQSWLPVRGRGTGEIRLTAGAGEPVAAAFTGAIDGIVWHDLTVSHVSVAGALSWPHLEVERMDVALDAASAATVQGGYNFQTRTVEAAKASGHLAPAWLQRWLPAGVTVDGTEFSATAEGPVMELQHAGELRVAVVHVSPVKPIGASATWQGRGGILENVAVHLAAGKTTLDLAGVMQADRASLKSLRFAPGGQEVWLLAAPATIEWTPAWRVAGLRLQGPVSRVFADFQGGEAGTLQMEMAQVSAGWWRDVIDLAGPDWQLQRLRFDGGLVDGKLKFAVDAQGQIELSPRRANVSLTATGDGGGVRLTAFKILEDEHVFAQAVGRLPLTWDVRAAPHLHLDPEGPIELQASTEPASPLWAALAKGFGLNLAGPMANAHLSGTLRDPSGELHLAVDRLEVDPGQAKFPLPAVEKLVLTAHAGRGVLTLDELTARVDGQPLQASGRLPMNESRWRQLLGDRATFDWSAAEGRVDFAEAELAPFARYVPDYLATRGKLEAHVALAGGNLSGELKLRDAATRPLAGLGIVQEIAGDVTLNGRTLTIRSFTGKLGGQPLTLQGSIELPAGGGPRSALTLKAEGVPLVRQAGVLVRSDLDLRTETDAAGVTRLSGTVNITDCLLLSDLRDLLPTGGTRGVARPPPYFAFDTPPFGRWPLAVEVRAPHTVRIRTALFNGTASARFQLGGTLGEPKATGEVSLDEGQVVFPSFVTFKVQLGAVRLSEADPYHPQLTLNGTARRYGYDLRMEARGPVDQPVITFTSSPALSSEQVLLMVMAGQVPASDVAAGASQQRLSSVGTYLGQSLFQEIGVPTDRLEVTAGEQISEKGHETYKFDYKLGGRWSLVGEYDEFDGYNAGLKWRIYTEERAHADK